MIDIPVNEFQTPITEDLLKALPEEVQEQLIDYIMNVKFIQNLISPTRERAKDRPRDEKGRIIVDLANPHILENMDYFREAALHFKKYGCYTFLKPNRNPNSEYGKWIRQELERCWEGMVRPEDGEWITGYMYWYLNYCPIMLTEAEGENTVVSNRVEDFPHFWEGIYWRFHYLEQARRGGLYNDFKGGQHCAELSRRGCSKSFSLAAIMSKNLVLGENSKSNKRTMTVLTAYQKEYLAGKDGTLSKFLPMLDFQALNTEFPRRRLKDSLNEMMWQMGYKDVDTGAQRGTLNTVIGVSSKDDEDKLRGKRGYIMFEEFGSFPHVKDIYNVVRYGVEEGNYVFGLIYLVGTAGNDENDFTGAQELVYNTKGYNIYSIPNVYDKANQGRKQFAFFYPAYVNRKGCYNKDGVSDVIKALIQILMIRYNTKYNSDDPNTIVRVIADMPITPAEAIVRVGRSMFPIADLNERLNQLESNPHEFDDIYIGTLAQKEDGTVKFVLTDDNPIRDYPIKDNKSKGAIEFYAMPEKDSKGKVPYNRYIIGHDPVDNDQADSMSLTSTFVLDLWTDRIVAEYTGRQDFADDNFEIVRKLCIFYNAKVLYEAHPYNQIVNTPNGKKLWKDIKIGDYLFSPSGKPVKVKDIPVNCKMPIYKLKLTDGREIECSDNHIWTIYQGASKQTKEITTIEMIKSGLKNKYEQHKFFIPESNCVDYSYKELPIDPYTMGLILAEGSINGSHCTKNNIQISSSKEDMLFYEHNIPYEVKYIGNKGYSWHIRINDCKQIMSQLNLLGTNSHTKFIPEIYKQSNYVQRMNLLKGIMDGDGFAGKKGASILNTCSKDLAYDVLSLCRSLGIKAWIQNNKNNVYRVAIASRYKIFKLPRKVVEQHVYKPYTKGSKASAILCKTAIESIEFDRYDMGKCVTVDSEDGLYLIGDYVVTHNCNKKGLFAYFSKMNCTHLLADTPEYLRDKQLVKYAPFGSNAKGVNAVKAVNIYADSLTRDWLLKPVPIIAHTEDGDIESTSKNLFFLKNKALIQELIQYNTEANFDRIRAFGMLMLYREEFMIMYQGQGDGSKNQEFDADYLGNSDFFTKNYDNRFK